MRVLRSTIVSACGATRVHARWRPLLLALGLGLGLLLGLSTLPAPGPRASASMTFPAPTWVDKTGPIALSSPASGTIDGQPVIAFGTESGYLYVVNARTGATLPGWPQPVTLGHHGPSAIESSPTIADLAGPGAQPIIVVGAGSTYVKDQQGGLIAFNANGTVRFRFRTQDVFNEWGAGPSRYRNGVFSTPAVGDVTGDGQQDIVFGSWDHNLYAISANGKLVPGFPIHNEDTIWSSPALFHVRGPANLEDIFIGSDASGRAGCYGGFVSDYTYRDGAPHVVWRHCENQTIWSSPAIGVINATGRPAVVVGTGFGERPPYKSDAYRLFAFYANTGTSLPGWPVPTAGPSFGSPAIGLLPGSTLPSVVDTSWCTACRAPGGTSMVDAWSGTGRRLWSQQLGGSDDLASPILVNLTSSGTNDVVVGSPDGLYALDGSTGDFLFGGSRTVPINTCSDLNAPLVEDVPGHGRGAGWHLFEACGGPVEVTGNGTLLDYPLPSKPLVPPPWAGWRDGPTHTGVAVSTLGLLASTSGAPSGPTTVPTTTVPTTTSPTSTVPTTTVPTTTSPTSTVPTTTVPVSGSTTSTTGAAGGTAPVLIPSGG